MIYRYIQQLPKQLIKICYIQLVVSIYSFLITVFWGIPFSPLSLLGNLFFNPILILFLGLSTLLFFTELFFIPNQYIAYILDFVSSWWIYILKCGPGNSFNITSRPPSYLLVGIICCATFIIIIQHYSHLKKCTLLLLLICCICCYMQQQEKPPIWTEINCNKGSIWLIATRNELILMDQGYMGQSVAAESFVEYTLVPTLIQLYGTCTITRTILLQPSTTTFKAVKKLLELCNIQHIYIPVWQTHNNTKIASAFMQMKEMANSKNCHLHRLTAAKYLLSKENGHTIELHTLPTSISTSGIAYTAYVISGSIDNKTFTFYPAKYTQQS